MANHSCVRTIRGSLAPGLRSGQEKDSARTLPVPRPGIEPGWPSGRCVYSAPRLHNGLAWDSPRGGIRTPVFQLPKLAPDHTEPHADRADSCRNILSRQSGTKTIRQITSGKGRNRTATGSFSVRSAPPNYTTSPKPPVGESNSFQPVDSRSAIRQRHEGEAGQEGLEPTHIGFGDRRSSVRATDPDVSGQGLSIARGAFSRLSEALTIVPLHPWWSEPGGRLELPFSGSKPDVLPLNDPGICLISADPRPVKRSTHSCRWPTNTNYEAEPAGAYRRQNSKSRSSSGGNSPHLGQQVSVSLIDRVCRTETRQQGWRDSNPRYRDQSPVPFRLATPPTYGSTETRTQMFRLRAGAVTNYGYRPIWWVRRDLNPSTLGLRGPCTSVVLLTRGGPGGIRTHKTPG